MVFFNYATMQMAAKIVYYGPGLCGKTTNLHHIYARTSPQSRGEMVSLETETDRTLFFDLLPIDVGVIGGFKTRLQLYTIPGQVFYNTTRKLVLKGVDGIVFVADSQPAMVEANQESFKNLRENLAEIGLTLDEIPLVLQLNKRDLPNIAAVDTILNALDPERRHEYTEASAVSGTGVFETLKLISKLTLRTLRRRMTGEDNPKQPSRRADPPAATSQFRVQGEGKTGPVQAMPGSAPTPLPATTAIGTPPAPSTRVKTAPIPAFAETGRAAPKPEPEVVAARVETTELSAARIMEDANDEPLPTQFIPTPALSRPSASARVLEDEDPGEQPAIPAIIHEPARPPAASLFATPPPPQPAVAPVPAPEEAPPLEASQSAPAVESPRPSEPDVDFSRSEKSRAPDVKHVKVRSSIDVMAELEALRKRATQSPAKTVRKETFAGTVPLPVIRQRRDVEKTLTVPVGAPAFALARSVRVTVSFEDSAGATIGSHDQVIELGETADVESLSVNLKFDLPS